MSVLNEAEIEVMRRYSDQPTSNLQMVAIRRCVATITSQGKRIAFLEALVECQSTELELAVAEHWELETLRAALRECLQPCWTTMGDEPDGSCGICEQCRARKLLSPADPSLPPVEKIG